ncbi:MAG: M61 family metallopeptidase [Metallibacterium sp.]
MVFYPAGHYSRAISLRPRVKLPPGWQFGSALQATATQDGTVQFAPVGLNTLVDSTADRQRVLREL